MKRLCCLLLVLVLSLPACFAAADDTDSFWVPLTLLESFDYSAEEWYSSSFNRATFTTLAALDILIDSDYNFELIECESYVGHLNDGIYAVYSTGTQYIQVCYFPSAVDELLVLPGVSNDPAYAKGLIQYAVLGGEYTLNDIDDIGTVMTALVEFFNN